MNIKKILLSVIVIGAVSAVAVSGTIAYFSDTETSVGNTISAGVIDISVDEGVTGSKWTSSYSADLADMKPGMTRDITFTVKNTGTNPIVLRKQIGTFVFGYDSTLTLTDCTTHGGFWDGTTCRANDTEGTYLPSVITYSMTVGSTDMIKSSWDVKMSDVKDLWIPLGPIAAGDTLTVKQSYHFDEATENWAQGDKLSFNISLYAEQVDGIGPNTKTGVVLDNKDTTTWASVIDGTLGLLTWDTAGNYKLKAWGVNDSSSFNLVYWNGSSEAVIGGPLTPVSGAVTESGTYAAFNSNSDAKYWLRPTPSSNANTLWEGNIVNQ